jgi:mono/diheme cytochrome c family protein
MNKLLSRAIPILMVTAIVAIACVHEIPLAPTTPTTGGTGTGGTGTGTGGTGTTTCDTTAFNYSTVINPMVQSFCVSCHGASTAASSGAGIDLSTYAKLLPYVTNGRFFGSINHSAGYSAMPKGGAQFSTCQITQVKKWIAGGAKNDTATVAPPPVAPSCDTTNFLYSTTIAPLLINNCVTCHAPGNPNSGGIDLSTFANAQAFALNGRLYGSITHAAGYSAMPKGMAQLSTCNITQFRKWIAAGAKNDTATVVVTPPPPPTTPAPTSNCSPDTVYFQNTIGPLINSTCAMSGCHDATSKASGVNLSTYANIVKYVSAGNAAGSTLYTITKSGKMPTGSGNAKYTTAQLAQLQTWINQGAKNNFCTSCDTTYTYAKAVAPLITTYCIGCHSASAAVASGGSIDLSTYTQVKVYATNGRLYGSVNHTAGYSAMPKNQAQLSTCQIAQFKKWIDAGAINN